MEPTENKSNASLIGVSIIILIIILGGLYFFTSNQKEAPVENTTIIVEEDGSQTIQESEIILEELEKEFETIDLNLGIDADTLE